MIQTYSCPSCGAGMRFDGEKKLLHCDHCNRELSLEEYYKLRPKEEVTEEERAKWDAMQSFSCPSCGAQLMTDAHTAATTCAYCGGAVVLESRLDGAETPDLVLPFAIGKEKAKELLRQWAKKRRFSPKVFVKESTLENISGMYVPYWMYSFDAQARVEAKCTRTRVERHGDTEKVHTDHYLVHREIEADFERIPADASEKMPDDVMEKLEPYSYGDLVAFDPAYLSGYAAEKYNYTNGELKPHVQQRADGYALQLAEETIRGYGSVQIVQKDIRLQPTKLEYALLPVWLLHFRYMGKDYPFSMNGQNGKIIGELPVSMARVIGCFLGIAALVFVVVFILTGI